MPIKNEEALLVDCQKAGYSIVSIGIPCEELPLSTGINKNNMPTLISADSTIFAGPEDCRSKFKNTDDCPAIWNICLQLGLMRFSGVGHSVDVGEIKNEDKKVSKLIDGEWKVTEEADW